MSLLLSNLVAEDSAVLDWARLRGLDALAVAAARQLALDREEVKALVRSKRGAESSTSTREWKSHANAARSKLAAVEHQLRLLLPRIGNDIAEEAVRVASSTLASPPPPPPPTTRAAGGSFQAHVQRWLLAGEGLGCDAVAEQNLDLWFRARAGTKLKSTPLCSWDLPSRHECRVLYVYDGRLSAPGDVLENVASRIELFLGLGRAAHRFDLPPSQLAANHRRSVALRVEGTEVARISDASDFDGFVAGVKLAQRAFDHRGSYACSILVSLRLQACDSVLQAWQRTPFEWESAGLASLRRALELNAPLDVVACMAEDALESNGFLSQEAGPGELDARVLQCVRAGLEDAFQLRPVQYPSLWRWYNTLCGRAAEPCVQKQQ
jgi:hypothetical protein